MKRCFREAVFSVVSGIPKGGTMSYGEVARRAGFPRAARAVGSLMRKNFDSMVPCHRVIRSDGRLGEYNRGGEDVKRKLLEKEGVLFDDRGRVCTA
ncbi:MAG: MGMT family protein [Candidatus Moranbacteria bacterium]|nr:MGMT family protein [Candidatus Moranbacteria bacterium]